MVEEQSVEGDCFEKTQEAEDEEQGWNDAGWILRGREAAIIIIIIIIIISDSVWAAQARTKR